MMKAFKFNYSNLKNLLIKHNLSKAIGINTSVKQMDSKDAVNSLNFFKKSKLISFKGNAKDYDLHHIDVSSVQALLIYGLTSIINMISYDLNNQIDEVEDRDNRVNYQIYLLKIQSINDYYNNPAKHSRELPNINRKICKFVEQGY